jgi:hypothetical protein
VYAQDLLIGNMSVLPDGPWTKTRYTAPYAGEELVTAHTDMKAKEQADDGEL